jgi:integrase
MIMAWVEVRGTRYRGLYRNAEGQRQPGKTFDYRHEAQQWAEEQERVALGAAPTSTDASVLFRDYAARWLRRRTGITRDTIRQYTTTVELIAADLGDYPLHALTRDVVESWAGTLDANELGAAGRNLRVKVLRMITKQAILDGLIAADPTAGVKRRPAELKARRQFLADDQIEDLLTAAADPQWGNSRNGGRRITLPEPGELITALLLAVDTGLRWEEIAGLCLDAITRDGNDFVVEVRRTVNRRSELRNDTKNHKPREVPVTSTRLAVVLRQQIRVARLARGPEGLLLARPDGTPLRYETWQRVHLAGAVKQAGIPTLTGWHDLRHTFGSRLAERGVPTNTIATLLGHSDEDVTRLYMHSSTRATLRAVMREALA